MCNFYAIKIWKYISNFDYVLRLDDDSFVRSNVKGIFNYCLNNKIDIGYVRRKLDVHKLSENTFKKFLSDDLKLPDEITRMAHKNFYNNFQLINVKFYLQKEAQIFIKDIESSNGIYYYRWGDSNIWSLIAHRFGAKICNFKGLRYQHRSHGKFFVWCKV